MSIYSRIKPPSNIRRRRDRGIILITTLLLLTLLAGFAIAAQNRALSQARVLDRIIKLEEERIALQSVRALALPLVGEVLLEGESEVRIKMEYEAEAFVVTLEAAQRRDWYRVFVVRLF